ncbi:MAG: TIGR03987 family protein [Robiginitomaculum sp.]|nr:MAG: TIGR03987 family protein [Robiginitomaculum sp.]
MPPLLIFAVILFTIALVFYTWGVWAEYRIKRLQSVHAKLFFAGVCVDSSATVLTYIAVGGLTLTAHSIMGFISLFLMIIHFVWALWVLRGNDEQKLTRFHRLSLFVWSVWMLSYVSGFVLGMAKL